jgi:putative serine protease PepD
MQQMTRTRLAIAIVAISLAAAGAAIGSYAASGSDTTTTVVTTQAAPAASTTPTTTVASNTLSIHDIYRRTYQGVVVITSNETGAQGKVEVQGSGFVYDTGGHIVTNFHVVQGTTGTKVAFADNSTYPATVVAHDSSTDLAVLKVDAPASKLHALTLGDSAEMEVGDPVVAIGSPFSLAETVTNGIVSALNRTISSDNNYAISGAIQTDAAINHGNSGGPLLNMRGRVVGINSQIESEGGGSDGVGFAIASDTVRSVVTQLLNTGKVAHAYLGVALESAVNGNNGALVASVKSGSPGAKAGLKAGDVITAFGGRPIANANAVIGAVNAKKPGDKVTVTYERGGHSNTTEITLGSRP